MDLGRRDYASCLDLQRELVARVQREPQTGYLLLVEHDPPVITLGRRGGQQDVLASPEALAADGVEVHRVSRGGQATYHGPGQLVVYPIVSLRGLGLRLGEYVHRLETAVIDVLGQLGIGAATRDGQIGVFVGDAKIAAFGVAVERWVCSHGLALNVDPELDHFRLLVPCGQMDASVTSIRRVLANRPGYTDADLMEQVRRRLADSLGKRLGVQIIRAAADGLLPQPSGSDEASSDEPRDCTDPHQSQRLPAWLKRPISGGKEVGRVGRLLDDLGLQTVCHSAKCPNLCECFGRGSATFMIMGQRCTRACRFCAVEKGLPLSLREDEPDSVAQAAAALKLRHVVITSVTRDDLSDGGAEHFARTIRAVRGRLAAATIEVLLPDFGGDWTCLEAVLSAGPDVLNHNIETVERLYPLIRPPREADPSAMSEFAVPAIGRVAGNQPGDLRRHLGRADYRRSLELLGRAAAVASSGRPIIKSGIMLGLGEEGDEVLATLADLHAAGCRSITVGQYLRPSAGHLPVARFVHPDEFARWGQAAAGMGFEQVMSGPLVRSSYMAGQ